MNRLTRKQASIVFKTRTRMIKVKGNYKNGYTDLTCRACKGVQETQNHALTECKALHPYEPPTSNEYQPFSADLNILKETAKTVEEVEKQLSMCSLGGTVNPGALVQSPVSTNSSPQGTGM